MNAHVEHSRFKGGPEGLSDEEAIQRLQTLCIGACDGIQDLADDARYKALRKALLSRPDLRPLAPAFVAAQANLESFVRHIRQTKDRQARREEVRSQFQALWQGLKNDPDGVSSSSWTGRPTTREQAAIVLALAPSALEAIARLIAEEERARDNGGPVEADRDDALICLRAFHEALGELIELAKSNRPLDGAFRRLKQLRREAGISVGKAVSAVPVTASALVAFAAVVGITDLFVSNLIVSLAAGGLAGNTVKDAMLKEGSKSPS